jgi:hypothetical protein
LATQFLAFFIAGKEAYPPIALPRHPHLRALLKLRGRDSPQL